ncbi:MAG TPA: Tsi3 family protein [Polyangia bacterium]|nr:Tsi3 family protein [Polyangia bacterium]
MSALARMFLVAVIATSTACYRARPAGPTRTMVHPNGLALTVPETFGGKRVAVAQTPTGFSVGLEPHSPRLVEHTLVTFNAGSASPAGTWPERRTVRGATIRYFVDSFPDASAGSGGPEYELRAWEPARGGHVAYLQHVQTEEGPDFSLIWALIAYTKPPP